MGNVSNSLACSVEDFITRVKPGSNSTRNVLHYGTLALGILLSAPGCSPLSKSDGYTPVTAASIGQRAVPGVSVVALAPESIDLKATKENVHPEHLRIEPRTLKVLFAGYADYRSELIRPAQPYKDMRDKRGFGGIFYGTPKEVDGVLSLSPGMVAKIWNKSYREIRWSDFGDQTQWFQFETGTEPWTFILKIRWFIGTRSVTKDEFVKFNYWNPVRYQWYMPVEVHVPIRVQPQAAETISEPFRVSSVNEFIYTGPNTHVPATDWMPRGMDTSRRF